MIKRILTRVIESDQFMGLLQRILQLLAPLIQGRQIEQGYATSTVFRLLHPGISGNNINGLDERKPRRPFRILWTNDKETPFGSLQRWFLIMSGMKGTVKFSDHLHTRELAREEKRQFHQVPEKVTSLSKQELTAKVKHAALDSGGAIVGITPMDESWIFEGTELPDWAYDAEGRCIAKLVVIGVEMAYDNFGQAPQLPAATEAMKQYDRGTEAAIGAAELLLESGYFAWGHAGPRAGRFLLVPAAEKAGLGNLGKHGSLISKEFGASLRLGAVVTNADLDIDNKTDFGSEDFCVNCQICVNECPGDALKNEKQWVRGVEKYYVDFDRCLPHFIDKNGCGICAAKCPYSRPQVRPKLLSKFEKQQRKKAIQVKEVS